VITLGIAVFQEVVTKGTWVNKGIKHYFGQRFFVEYTKEATIRGEIMEMPVDDEVPFCDYRTITPKKFF
jgi:hypothetical protein